MNIKHALAALSLLVAAAPLGAQAQSITLSADRLGAGGGVHVAQSGDTLFGLAQRFLGDPLQWPVLWSYNPQITNPHWIYPGDIVFTRSPDPAEVASLELQVPGNVFPLAGFYTSEELVSFATLQYAAVSRLLLSEGDKVYLEFEDPDSVQVGERYSINRVVDRVTNRDDELVAVRYQVTGMVEITRLPIEGDSSTLITGEILDLFDTIERGDVLFLDMPQVYRVTPTPATVDIEAEIMAHLNPVRFIHEQDYVFINAGSDDGVATGNRFQIWDRRDEGIQTYTIREPRFDYQEDVVPELPWERIGEALVISVNSEYSTAVLTTVGDYEISDGFRVTLQRGY